MNFSIGHTVGGYEIVAPLGSGGMGEVYRVRNVISDREDAMKVLLASLQSDADFATRFLREIKVQARLVHPNIAQLYTAFKHDGNLIMILELVQGMSLLEKLERGRIAVGDAIDYTSQALAALSYAHRQGVIHRDIKPGNIMVTRDGAVKLMDFGIAKAATDRSLTITGNLIGSLHYMSPEQVRAEALDGRSDLYSLGVVLYQMATGRKPFEGESEYSVMRAQVETPPPPPRTIDPGVPEALSMVILRALAKDPQQRFQTGEEFRQALDQVQTLMKEAALSATRMVGSPQTSGAWERQPSEAAAPPPPETAASPPVPSAAGLYPSYEPPAPPAPGEQKTPAPSLLEERTPSPIDTVPKQRVPRQQGGAGGRPTVQGGAVDRRHRGSGCAAGRRRPGARLAHGQPIPQTDSRWPAVD